MWTWKWSTRFSRISMQINWELGLGTEGYNFGRESKVERNSNTGYRCSAYNHVLRNYWHPKTLVLQFSRKLFILSGMTVIWPWEIIFKRTCFLIHLTSEVCSFSPCELSAEVCLTLLTWRQTIFWNCLVLRKSWIIFFGHR